MVDYTQKKWWKKEEIFNCGQSLKELKHDINRLIQKYGEDAKIEQDDYNTNYIMIQVAETENQMNARIEEEISNEREITNRELAELRRLMEKYGA